jgi:hypothetical protein
VRAKGAVGYGVWSGPGTVVQEDAAGCDGLAGYVCDGMYQRFLRDCFLRGIGSRKWGILKELRTSDCECQYAGSPLLQHLLRSRPVSHRYKRAWLSGSQDAVIRPNDWSSGC